MASDAAISVAIPTYNRAEDLRRCLDSLARQSRRLAEIVVVDNGSTDQTPQVARTAGARYVPAPGLPLSALFNVCWRETTGEFVAFLNDDVTLVPGWLEQIERTLQAHSDAGAVGGPTIAMRPQHIQRFFERAESSRWLRPVARMYNAVAMHGRINAVGEYFDSGAYSIGGSLRTCLDLPGPFPVDLLSITNVAIRRRTLEALDGFDEGFRTSHIDGDFFLRMRAAAIPRIFDPKAVAWHHVNPVGPTRSAYAIGRDTARLYRRRPPAASAVGWLRFAVHIGFFNLFWIYQAGTERSPAPLRGILGFAAGALGR